MSNNLAAFQPEIWSNRLVMNLDQINVGKNLVNTEWEGDLRFNPTVHVRTLGNVSMNAYTKNSTTISYQDLAPVDEDFTVDDSTYFAFKVDDVDKAQSDINALDAYTRRAAVSMSNEVEAKIFSCYSQALTANKISASGSPITLDSSSTATGSTRGVYPVISSLAEALSLQSVPEIGRFLVVDPKIRTLLWNDTAHFIRASDLGDSIVMSGRFVDGKGTPANQAPGFIGTILGFDVYMVTHLPTTSAGSPTIVSKYMVAGTRDAITYAAQITEIEAIRLQDSFASAIRGLLLHDATTFAETSKCLATAQVLGG
jgi:hypothetical protein